MNKVISPIAYRGRRTAIILSLVVLIISILLLMLFIEDLKLVLIWFMSISAVLGIVTLFVPDTYRIIWKNERLEVSSAKSKIEVPLSIIESVNERFSFQAGTGNEIKYYDISLNEDTEFGRVISFKLKVLRSFKSTGKVKKIGELRYAIYSLKKYGRLPDQDQLSV